MGTFHQYFLQTLAGYLQSQAQPPHIKLLL